MGAALGPSGLAVFEYDDPEAEERFLAVLGGALPRTPVARTGTGKSHVYFSANGDGIEKAARDGMELRAGSHHCLVPPSVHPDTGNPYTWVEGHEPESVTLLPVPETV